MYSEAGVEEVWLVDPKGVTIEVRGRDREERFGGSEPAGSSIVPGFQLTPAELF